MKKVQPHDDPPRVHIQSKVPEKIRSEIDKHAKERNCTRSYMIADLLEYAISQFEEMEVKQ